MIKKYFILVAALGFGCIGTVQFVDPEKPKKDQSAVKEIPFGPPMFNTSMSMDRLQQKFGRSENIRASQAARIVQLENMLKDERQACSIERNAILNGK